MKNITGWVNVHAGEAHVTASTPDLRLGTMELSGDPTFCNSAGNVIIGGNIGLGPADLAIVASRDIINNPAATTISGQGHITMIAGAQFTTDGPASSLNASDSATTL